MKAVLYVSTSCLPGSVADQIIAGLVEVARVRNGRDEITGCLLCSGWRFAQWIEGPDGAVDALMKDIEGDTRHREIIILKDGKIDRREFADWALGYSGTARLVDALISDAASGRLRAIKRLIKAMTEFVAK